MVGTGEEKKSRKKDGSDNEHTASQKKQKTIRKESKKSSIKKTEDKRGAKNKAQTKTKATAKSKAIVKPQVKAKDILRGYSPSLTKDITIVDNLSRLMQTSSQGCTCICLVNNKLCITDNNMSKNDSSSKSKLIQKTMNYFEGVAKGKPIENRAETIFEICKKRIQGEESGYVKLDDEKINEIIKIACDDPARMRERIATGKHENGSNIYKRHEKKYASVACDLVGEVMHDLKLIEKFLQNPEKQKNPFTLAFKGADLGRIYVLDKDEEGYVNPTITFQDYYKANNGQPGYLIIYMDSKEGKTVHAEMQMIDFLLFTGILQQTTEPIYLGISKGCCKTCEINIKACNQYKGGPIIQFKEGHGQEFDSNYGTPIFLHQDTALYLNRGYYESGGNKYDIAVGDNLNEKMSEIIKQDKEAKIYLYQDCNAANAIRVQNDSLKKLLAEATSLTPIKFQQSISDSDNTPITNSPKFAQEILQSSSSDENSILVKDASFKILLDAAYKKAQDNSELKTQLGNMLVAVRSSEQLSPTYKSARRLFSQVEPSLPKPIKIPHPFLPLILDEVKKDGDCGFRSILGEKALKREDFDRTEEVIKPLTKAMENNTKIKDFIDNDIIACYQDIRGQKNENEFEKALSQTALPDSIKEFFTTYQGFVVVGQNIIDDKIRKDYLKYFASDTAIWPAMQGIVAAFAELHDKKIYCWNPNKIIKGDLNPEINLTLGGYDQKIDPAKNYDTVHMVYNGTNHFDLLKKEYIPQTDPPPTKINLLPISLLPELNPISSDKLQNLPSPATASISKSPPSPKSLFQGLLGELSKEHGKAMSTHVKPSKRVDTKNKKPSNSPDQNQSISNSSFKKKDKNIYEKGN